MMMMMLMMMMAKGSEGRIKQAQDERCLASCREIKTMWAASLKTIYPDDAGDGDDEDGDDDDGGGDDDDEKKIC